MQTINSVSGASRQILSFDRLHRWDPCQQQRADNGARSVSRADSATMACAEFIHDAEMLGSRQGCDYVAAPAANRPTGSARPGGWRPHSRDSRRRNEPLHRENVYRRRSSVFVSPALNCPTNTPYRLRTARHPLPTRELFAARVALHRTRLSKFIPPERSHNFAAAGRQGANSFMSRALATEAETTRRKRTDTVFFIGGFLSFA